MEYTNYIVYSFDPFKDIKRGMQIVDDNGLKKWTSLSKIDRDNSKEWENTNFSGKTIGSSDSIEKQFDLEDGLSKFISTRLLKEIEDSYDTVLSEVDLGGNILPSRIKFSSKPMGVFDFGQASKGLIRPVEFFSTVDNKLIDPKLINKETKGGQDFYFYFKKTDKIFVQRRQEGTTEMVDNCPELSIELNNDVDLYLPYRSSKIINECNGFRLRYTSTNPKVYAYREKIGGGSTPYVDLYIPMGGTATKNPESMSIRTIPNLLLARTLERAGVKVRIFGIWSTRGGSEIYTINLLLKNYGETISTNQLAIFCADTRFYRYWLSISARGLIYDKYGVDKDVFAGTGTLNTSRINDYIMPRIRNYTLYNIEKGDFSSQLIDKNLILFVSLDAESDDKVDSDKVREEIKNKYIDYVDYISIKFSVNPAKIIKDIQVRRKEEGETNDSTRQYIRNSIANVYKTTRELRSSRLELTTQDNINQEKLALEKVSSELKELRTSKSELTTQEKIDEEKLKVEQDGKVLDLENQYILDTDDMYKETEKGRQKLFEIVNKTIK